MAEAMDSMSIVCDTYITPYLGCDAYDVSQ